MIERREKLLRLADSREMELPVWRVVVGQKYDGGQEEEVTHLVVTDGLSVNDVLLELSKYYDGTNLRFYVKSALYMGCAI